MSDVTKNLFSNIIKVSFNKFNKNCRYTLKLKLFYTIKYFIVLNTFQLQCIKCYLYNILLLKADNINKNIHKIIVHFMDFITLMRRLPEKKC